MKTNISKRHYILLSVVILLVINSCKKLTSISEPINSVTTNEVFASEALASNALNGIYSNMSYNGIYLTNALSSSTGCSSDELIANDQNTYQTNSLLADDGGVYAYYWQPMYKSIYDCNAVIEGLDLSGNINISSKQKFRGQALFLRAFNYFYLTNLFGDVPLVTTTLYANTRSISRTSSTQVYDQIIADLKEAQNLLSGDFQIINGQTTRVYANQFAATALLSRVYLYNKKWAEAETESTKLIANPSMFKLATDLNKVFLVNSQEAIWQLQVTDRNPFATKEGYTFVPYSNSYSPTFFLTNQMIQSFELGDARFTSWVGKSIVGGVTYLYPFKYKIRQGSSGNITEYYNPLRLAEQYLIRAEAKAQQGGAVKLNEAVSDVNTIRFRAGLTVPLVASTMSQAQIISAIAQENRIEFFAELGHRWLDLKRTNKANDILGQIKGSDWQSTDQLYPIPDAELKVNSKLVQNPGY